MLTRQLLIAGFVGAALLTACGGTSSPGYGSYGSSPSASTSAASSPAGAAQGATVAVAANAQLGQILVDSKGMTLYLFQKDSGTTSACYGACASAWPPLLTSGTPQVGSGANASLLGTTKRTDGTTQVTYAGHPLYYFVRDHNPGDATGQGVNGFGGLWYAVTPAGAAASGSTGGY